MGYVSIEMDVAQSLAKWYRENIRYRPQGGLGGAEADKKVTGFSGGFPYGDVYRINDTFITEGDSQKAGEVYYVADAKPGSPDLLLQRDHPAPLVAPHVLHTDTYDTLEKRSPDNRVFVGIRNRGNSRFGVVQGGYIDRLLHNDGEHFIIARPFWRGTFYVQIDSDNAWDTKGVFETINSGLDFTSSLYRLRVTLRPIRTELGNILTQGRWTTSINMEATASVTVDTPIHDLPPGVPTIAWPWKQVTGVTPVVEQMETDYYETAGDYQVGGGPYHNPLPAFPEEDV